MAITKKQKDVFDYIVEYSCTHGCSPTQKEIKEHFGLKSFGSVQRYIKYLVDAGYLESDWNARRGLKAQNFMSENNFEVEIPLLGLVAAGNPIEALENPDNTIAVPSHLIKPGHRFFALTVKGESMIEDGILEDDVLICQVQNEASQGQKVIGVVEGDATVKNFFKFKDRIELHPANSTMTPIVIRGGDFRIAGVVVGLVRRYL
jgi:SOS regulatory protein LexA